MSKKSETKTKLLKENARLKKANKRLRTILKQIEKDIAWEMKKCGYKP